MGWSDREWRDWMKVKSRGVEVGGAGREERSEGKAEKEHEEGREGSREGF